MILTLVYACRTYAALYGDSNGDHGPFSCRVERGGAPVGVWAWYDGGSRWWWPYQHNTKLCEVSGLPNASYSIILHVEVDQVQKGVAVRLTPLRQKGVQADSLCKTV